MPAPYVVELTPREREDLAMLTTNTRIGAQKRKRAEILLACDRGLVDAILAKALGCGESTIYPDEEALC